MNGNVSLSSNMIPIASECVARDLPVEGELPRALNGTLFRNGPNPQFPVAAQHWFAGDGMVHAFSLSDGRASYRNAWVRTAKWAAERRAGRPLVSGYTSRPELEGTFADEGVANTNVVWHAGRLLALEEGHLPIELDPATLATRGVQDFSGGLRGPFTAHPKIDPITGELVFFGFSVDGELTRGMRFGTLDAAGRVTRFEHFEAPYCSMVHDFAVTRRHVVFPVLPLAGSMTRQLQGGPSFAWEPELGSHIGLILREQGVSSLRWFRTEACFVFHVLNAWDDGGRIIVDVMQYDEPPLFPHRDGTMRLPAPDARLVRWTIDPAAGTDAVTRQPLDDTAGEFPRIDDRRSGLRHRFGAIAGRSRPGAGLDSLVWLDLTQGSRSLFTLPEGDGFSEPVFVPRSEDAAEGDGWLLATVWRAAENRSDVAVFDTAGLENGPVATIRLPHRVPAGFHGNWVANAV
ncbi:MAG TPA: carotenoid oxygenase family protein [Rhodopila sp.]|jgi:carotenoid cleavage dioxygenase|nr:carotenoid oxygenase family protein [Rhodopila sp.]